MALEIVSPEVLSSHVYPFIVDVNIEKDTQEITGGRRFKFNVRDMIWYVGIKITPEKSAIIIVVKQRNVCAFQIVCSILNYPGLGTITLTSNDIEKPQKFFDWKDIQTIQEKNDSMQICFNFIDLTKAGNQMMTLDYMMTKQLHMKRMFENGEFSDFLIKTEKKDFKVHKIILSARSPVFDAMFRSNMKETKTGEMIIENLRSVVVEEMLLFMYADVTTKLSEMFSELFEAAHLYDVRDLERICIEHMSTHICVENVTGILNLCDKYLLEEPKEAALKFIRENEKSVVKRTEYLLYLMETLKIENVGERLKLAHKYELLIELKQFLLEFIATNYQDVLKDKDYREMYRNEEWMNIILQVDDYMSNYSKKVNNQQIAPTEDNTKHLLKTPTKVFLIIALAFFIILIFLYLAFA